MWRKFEQLERFCLAYVPVFLSHLPIQEGIKIRRKVQLGCHTHPSWEGLTPGRRQGEKLGGKGLVLFLLFKFISFTLLTPMSLSTSCLCAICLALYSSTVALHTLVSPDVSQDANNFRPTPSLTSEQGIIITFS